MIFRSLIVAPVLLLAGCASLAPGYNTVEIERALEDSYARDTYLEARASLYDTRPLEVSSWWTEFSDPKLAELVALGLEDNRNLEAAIANINAARAALSLSRKAYYPSDTQNLSWRRVGTSSEVGFQQSDLTILDTNIGALWEFDLFGRISRGITVAETNLAKNEALLSDLQSLLVANIAETYLNLRGLQNQYDVTLENTESLERTVALTVIIRDAGRGTDLDVERAREQLASTLATLSPLNAQIDAEKYTLGVLIGETPRGISTLISERAPLPIAKGTINIGSPAGLIRRRPDVAAAELSLVEANARIGLRKSAAFPVIGLSGAFGLTSNRAENILNTGAINFSFGPVLSFSAVEFIRAKDRVDAATSDAEAELARYEATVLSALAEVETALSRQARLQEQIVSLEEAKRAASEAARLARIRFENGASDFLTVLDADRRSIAADISLARTQTDLALSQVAVFRALRAGPV